MALSLQLGYPDVPKSITNPNVNTNDALDVGYPMPFLTFIKLINVSFEPDSLQAYYNYYIQIWNTKNVSKSFTDTDLIIERYKDFLRELSLKYTTLEEKKFLSKIDFDDPYDLDVAIGFYAKKLKDITSYYNSKRNDIRFNLIRNKLKGTNFGSERNIVEITLNYLKELEDGKILFDYDLVKSKIEIEIEELFDTYPLYFNQTPDDTKYDNKDLDYGLDIFLKSNTEILTSVFSSISDELKNLKELDDLLDNKRLLTQKNVFTDFYYLSTGNTVTNFISGKLFTSDNKISTFLNRDYPTSASTEQSELKTPREKGFFRPINTSIVLIDGKTSSFTFNLSNLSPNSLYYFPDPNIMGDNGDVVTFIVDDSYLKRNYSSGIANNQPKSEPYDTKYYGYVSKIDPNVQKYMDMIFDMGYIKDLKRDIYGNTLGLFSNEGKYESGITIVDTTIRYNMLINGHTFYDDLFNEGFSYDYSTYDDTTFSETTRSGLSTYTGDFSIVTPDITLYSGFFNSYSEFAEPTENVPVYQILESAFIRDDYAPYPETYSSDLSAFESGGEYYYSELLEGGVASDTPYIRALFDPLYPSLTGNFTEVVRTSSLNVYDGGEFGFAYDFEINYGLNTPVVIQNDYLTEFYTLSDLPADFNGKLYIKNSYTRTVNTLLNTLPHISTKYAAGIVSELEDEIQKFDLSNDIMFLETPNYLVIEKLEYSDGAFVDSKTNPIYITHNSDWSDKLSNRFKKNNDVYYCKLQSLSSNTLSSVVVYPIIYKFDTVNFNNVVLYNDSSEQFTISSLNVWYDSVSNPTLTYSSRNNIFKISFLIKDQNGTPELFEYDFILNPDVQFLKKSNFKFGNYGYTTIYETIPTTYNFFLSSGSYSTSSFELIL